MSSNDREASTNQQQRGGFRNCIDHKVVEPEILAVAEERDRCDVPHGRSKECLKISHAPWTVVDKVERKRHAIDDDEGRPKIGTSDERLGSVKLKQVERGAVDSLKPYHTRVSPDETHQGDCAVIRAVGSTEEAVASRETFGVRE